MNLLIQKDSSLDESLVDDNFAARMQIIMQLITTGFMAWKMSKELYRGFKGSKNSPKASGSVTDNVIPPDQR